jgi:hypothetical protein
VREPGRLRDLPTSAAPIGVPRGGALGCGGVSRGPRIRPLGKIAKLELVRTPQEGLALLRSGGVEALIHDRAALQAEAVRDPSLRVLDVTLTEDDYVVVVGKRNGSLLAALNAEMEKLRTVAAPNGQSPLAALCARYQIDPGIKPIVKQPVKPTAASGPAAAPPQDIGRRLDAIESRLRELQQTLSRIDSLLERSDSGR